MSSHCQGTRRVRWRWCTRSAARRCSSPRTTCFVPTGSSKISRAGRAVMLGAFGQNDARATSQRLRRVHSRAAHGGAAGPRLAGARAAGAPGADAPEGGRMSTVRPARVAGDRNWSRTLHLMCSEGLRPWRIGTAGTPRDGSTHREPSARAEWSLVQAAAWTRKIRVFPDGPRGEGRARSGPERSGSTPVPGAGEAIEIRQGQADG